MIKKPKTIEKKHKLKQKQIRHNISLLKSEVYRKIGNFFSKNEKITLNDLVEYIKTNFKKGERYYLEDALEELFKQLSRRINKKLLVNRSVKEYEDIILDYFNIWKKYNFMNKLNKNEIKQILIRVYSNPFLFSSNYLADLIVSMAFDNIKLKKSELKNIQEFLNLLDFAYSKKPITSFKEFNLNKTAQIKLGTNYIYMLSDKDLFTPFRLIHEFTHFFLDKLSNNLARDEFIVEYLSNLYFADKNPELFLKHYDYILSLKMLNENPYIKAANYAYLDYIKAKKANKKIDFEKVLDNFLKNHLR